MNLVQILFGFYFAVVGAYLAIILTRFVIQRERILDKMDEGWIHKDTGEGWTRASEGWTKGQREGIKKL